MPWIGHASIPSATWCTSSGASPIAFQRRSRPRALPFAAGRRFTITSAVSAPSAPPRRPAIPEEAGRRAASDWSALEDPTEGPALGASGVRAHRPAAGGLDVPRLAAQAANPLDVGRLLRDCVVVVSHAEVDACNLRKLAFGLCGYVGLTAARVAS